MQRVGEVLDRERVGAAVMPAGMPSTENQIPDTNSTGNMMNWTTGCAVSGDGMTLATRKASEQQHSAPRTNVMAIASSGLRGCPCRRPLATTSRTAAAPAARVLVASVCAAIRTCAGTGVVRRRW